jgi:hypothetical protein
MGSGGSSESMESSPIPDTGSDGSSSSGGTIGGGSGS